MDRRIEIILATYTDEEIVNELAGCLADSFGSLASGFCVFENEVGKELISQSATLAYLLKRLKKPKLFKIADGWSTDHGFELLSNPTTLLAELNINQLK